MKSDSLAKKFLSCLSAAALVCTTMGTGFTNSAFADGNNGDGDLVASTAPVSCGNGWELTYSTTDTSAYITGVATAGNGTLSIPNQIDGKNVTTLSKGAFMDCTQLTAVTIPNTVTLLRSEVFCGSGLTSVTIPSSIKAISYRCFKNCAYLQDVEFEGDSLLYLAQEAFMYDVSLTCVKVPWLTSHPVANANADSTNTLGVEPQADTQAIGRSCFANCTSLKTVEYEGKVGHETPDYFVDISCFNNCPTVDTFIWHCKKDGVESGTSGNKQFSVVNNYYTLDFYNSKEDAANYTNRVASVTYEPKNGEDTFRQVKTLSLINGTEDYSRYKLASCSDAIPEPPAGKVWGVADHGVKGDWDTLDDSYQVIAVDPDDLDYGWVSSPAIDKYLGGCEVSNSSGSMGSSDNTKTYCESDLSIPEVKRVQICGPDGVILDSDKCELVWEKINLTFSASRISVAEDGDWYEVDNPVADATPTETGVKFTRFRVSAVNTETDSKTDAVKLDVYPFSPTIHAYSNYTFVNNLGAISCGVAESLNGEIPAYNVIVPSSDWRNQMIGAGLAGIGKGIMLFDCGSEVSTDANRANKLSGAQDLQIVGSTSTVPQSVDVSDGRYLSDWLVSTNTGDTTRYRSDSTPQALSAQVYSTIGGGSWGVGWGGTALVMSGTSAGNALPAAQLAYQEGAPVFFADASGGLSSADLASLASGGFSRVVIAGTESQVSASCASAVAGATGLAPERVLGTQGTAFEASLAFAEEMVAAGNSFDCVAVADGTNYANIVQAAQVAAVNQGVVLVCNSSREVKDAEKYLYNLIKAESTSAVQELYICGNFQASDSQAESRLTSIWNTPLSTNYDSNDTVSVEGCLYKLSGSSATLVKTTETAAPNLTVGSFSLDGSSYKVTSVAAGAFGPGVSSVTLGDGVSGVAAGAFSSASGLESLSVRSKAVTKVAASQFAGLSKLSSVSFSGAVSSVGANAFRGCSSLRSVSLGSSVSSVGAGAFWGCSRLSSLGFGTARLASVGANAYRGCTSLKSAVLGARLSSVGAGAFRGCTSLRSAVLGARVSSVGASAFWGCRSLRTLVVRSAKLTKKRVGAAAFKGMPSKATVKAPKSKLKAYKKVFRSRGLPKKAKFKKC